MEDYGENNNYFLPNDDIFTAYLNAENDKQSIKMQYICCKIREPYELMFREQKRNDPHLQISNYTLSKANLIGKDECNNLFLGQNLINKYSNIKDKFAPIIESNSSNVNTSKKQRKKSERYKNSFSSVDKATTLHSSSLTAENSKNIFKTIKIKNAKKKSEKTENDIKKLVRLYKNRISAKKCRQKRKAYIEALEKKVDHLEQELANYENLKKNNIMEVFLDELNKKEEEILAFNKSKDRIIQSLRIKEFKNLQNQVCLDIFKKLIQNIIPLEFKLFASKYIKFADISNFYSFDELVKKIMENQLILDEIYNLRSGNIDKMNNVPLKIFSFMENLKEFLFNFQDLLKDIKKFDDIN